MKKRIYLIGSRDLHIVKTILEENKYNVQYPSIFEMVEHKSKYDILCPILDMEDIFDEQIIIYFVEPSSVGMAKHILLEKYLDELTSGEGDIKTKVLLLFTDGSDIIKLTKEFISIDQQGKLANYTLVLDDEDLKVFNKSHENDI